MWYSLSNGTFLAHNKCSINTLLRLPRAILAPIPLVTYPMAVILNSTNCNIALLCIFSLLRLCWSWLSRHPTFGSHISYTILGACFGCLFWVFGLVMHVTTNSRWEAKFNFIKMGIWGKNDRLKEIWTFFTIKDGWKIVMKDLDQLVLFKDFEDQFIIWQEVGNRY